MSSDTWGMIIAVGLSVGLLCVGAGIDPRKVADGALLASVEFLCGQKA